MSSRKDPGYLSKCPISDLLVSSCTWHGNPCDKETDFVVTITDLGVCYTFNMKEPALEVTEPGSLCVFLKQHSLCVTAPIFMRVPWLLPNKGQILATKQMRTEFWAFLQCLFSDKTLISMFVTCRLKFSTQYDSEHGTVWVHERSPKWRRSQGIAIIFFDVSTWGSRMQQTETWLGNTAILDAVASPGGDTIHEGSGLRCCSWNPHTGSSQKDHGKEYMNIARSISFWPPTCAQCNWVPEARIFFSAKFPTRTFWHMCWGWWDSCCWMQEKL